jgi:hypothetical protein
VRGGGSWAERRLEGYLRQGDPAGPDFAGLRRYGGLAVRVWGALLAACIVLIFASVFGSSDAGVPLRAICAAVGCAALVACVVALTPSEEIGSGRIGLALFTGEPFAVTPAPGPAYLSRARRERAERYGVDRRPSWLGWPIRRLGGMTLVVLGLQLPVSLAAATNSPWASWPALTCVLAAAVYLRWESQQLVKGRRELGRALGVDNPDDAGPPSAAFEYLAWCQAHRLSPYPYRPVAPPAEAAGVDVADSVVDGGPVTQTRAVPPWLRPLVLGPLAVVLASAVFALRPVPVGDPMAGPAGLSVPSNAVLAAGPGDMSAAGEWSYVTPTSMDETALVTWYTVRLPEGADRNGMRACTVDYSSPVPLPVGRVFGAPADGIVGPVFARGWDGAGRFITLYVFRSFGGGDTIEISVKAEPPVGACTVS